MAFDFVREGMGAEHDSAQNSLAAIYGLRHSFLEPGRQKLHLSLNYTDTYKLGLPPTQKCHSFVMFYRLVL